MDSRIAQRVLLIGWDAADWTMIRPLLEAGKMPALARLIVRGVSGNLATIQPMLSPMLWTTIATGKRADKHGICGFVEPLPDRSGIRPVTSTSRQCKAVWNILSQVGLSSNVISWFASHPAEPIRGSVVSDRYAAQVNERGESLEFAAGTFHPVELEQSMASLLVKPDDLEADALLPFVPLASEIDQDTDDRLIKLARLIAKTSTIHAAACRQIVETRWDFTAIYYSGIDEFGHFFMPFHPPRLPNVSESDARIYQHVMEGCYRFHDMMLGTLMNRVGSDTTIVLVSDHGFQSGSGRPSADAWQQPETWHRQFGIVVAAGPGISQGRTLYGATLLDVMPTLLTLFGLAVGDDMDGRPWLEILDRQVQPARIDSWEKVPGDDGQHAVELREDPVAAAAMIAQLVELGYVAALDDDAEKAIAAVLRDRKINLAVALTTSTRAATSLSLWQQLASEYPDEQGFLVQLASCYQRLGRHKECLAALEQIERPLCDSSFVRLMLAGVAIADDRRGDALVAVREVADQDPQDAAILNRLGELFIKLEQWDDAEQMFRKSLVLLVDNPLAYDGLAHVSLKQGRHQMAAENAMLAVGLAHYFPAAHFHLGEALVQLGRQSDAIAAFETCLGMGYQPITTHERLAALYRLRNPRLAKHHENCSYET